MTNKTKLNRAQRRLQERRQRRAGAGGHQESAPSRPKAPGPSSSLASRADSIAHLERLDGFAFLRNKLREISKDRGDWAGIPMPLADERLIVEPRYPNAQALMAMGRTDVGEDGGQGLTLINQWYSTRRRADVLLIRTADGRIDWGFEPGVHSLPYALSTLNCAEAWGIEQESNAVNLLGTLVSHRQFKQYMLTGMFMERSPRSGVHYLFRRLRPTVAIAADQVKNTTRILCALCMHPIAYYSRSWAGAMCPTDDLVAHLMMMRGDEAMFWRRSTQHPAWRPEAGL